MTTTVSESGTDAGALYTPSGITPIPGLMFHVTLFSGSPAMIALNFCSCVCFSSTAAGMISMAIGVRQTVALAEPPGGEVMEVAVMVTVSGLATSGGAVYLAESVISPVGGSSVPGQ